MGFWNIFKRKEKDNRTNHDFNEEDRNLSLEIRKQKAELKRLELERESELRKLEFEKRKIQLQEEIDELKGEDFEDYEEEGSSSDAMLMMLLSKVLGNSPQTTAETHTSPLNNSQVSAVDFSEEQIKEIWEKLPNSYKKYAKGLTEESLRNLIKTQIPTASNKSIDIAIKVVNS
jgi:hypothetical protein